MLKWAGWIVCLLTGIVLGLKSLREPDIWWQLATGRWILAHRQVMHTDIFSYTFSGTPWVNVKWGFEVLMQWVAGIGGPELTPLLQSIADVLLLTFVFRIYKLLRSHILLIENNAPSASIIACGLLLLVACEFRFIGRPEMTSHVFTAIFLFFILRYRFRPGKAIYWLIPLQVAWANLHEAYGTGMVMMAAATLAAWAEYYYSLRQKPAGKGVKNNAPVSPTFVPQRPLMLIYCTIGVLLAPALHPYGPEMIIHPFDIFSQVGENKFTTELLSFSNPGYWHKEAYISIGLLVFCLFSLFLKYRSAGNTRWYQRPVKTYGLPYLVLFALFFYLSLTAYRNIPFFIIIATPIAASGLDGLWLYLLRKQKTPVTVWPIASLGLCFAAGIALYIGVCTNQYYKLLGGDKDRYGLRLNPLMHPIGATDFIHSHQLKGHCFSDFLVSNYPLWKLNDYKTFIDLRDLDVFPAGFFEQLAYVGVKPDALNELDKKYHFTYALLLRRQFPAIHAWLAANPQWSAVYADPVAVLYVKREAAPAAWLPAPGTEVPFSHPATANTSGIANAISHLFWPLYNSDQKEPVDYDIIAADYYQSVGHMPTALAYAKKARQNHITDYLAEDMLGNIYLKLMAADTASAHKQQYIDSAYNAYQTASTENRKDAGAWSGLGSIDIYKGDYSSAEGHLRTALKLSPDNISTLSLLAQLQIFLVQQNPANTNTYLERRIDYLKKAYQLSNDPKLRFYLGVAYGQHGDCEEAGTLLHDMQHIPGIPDADREVAAKVLQQCGAQ